MATANTATANCAKLTTAANGSRTRRKLRSNVQIIDCAIDLFPNKTSLQLAEITNTPLRTVEAWMTGAVKIPSDKFILLLQSDWGRDFLSAVMVDAEPRWWTKLKAFFNALDIMSMQRITRRKLKEALDADYVSQVSAAQMLQDETYYAGQPSPHRQPVRRKTRA
jgi:hypothetical protein